MEERVASVEPIRPNVIRMPPRRGGSLLRDPSLPDRGAAAGAHPGGREHLCRGWHDGHGSSSADCSAVCCSALAAPKVARTTPILACSRGGWLHGVADRRGRRLASHVGGFHQREQPVTRRAVPSSPTGVVGLYAVLTSPSGASCSLSGGARGMLAPDEVLSSRTGEGRRLRCSHS